MHFLSKAQNRFHTWWVSWRSKIDAVSFIPWFVSVIFINYLFFIWWHIWTVIFTITSLNLLKVNIITDIGNQYVDEKLVLSTKRCEWLWRYLANSWCRPWTFYLGISSTAYFFIGQWYEIWYWKYCILINFLVWYSKYCEYFQVNILK